MPKTLFPLLLWYWEEQKLTYATREVVFNLCEQRRASVPNVAAQPSYRFRCFETLNHK
jgi:hypothetical protein